MKNKEFNIMKKRFLAALLCLCLLVGLVPGAVTTAFAASQHNIGDTVWFAGHEWYIIGTETDGVTAPAGCYTLFAKNNDFGSTVFGDGNYKDSTLCQEIGKIADSFSNKDKSNIVARNTLDGIMGESPTGQYLWPLSMDEVNSLNDAIKTFSSIDYYTRTGGISSINYFYWAYYYRHYSGDIVAALADASYAIRPALYVKAEALPEKVEGIQVAFGGQWWYVVGQGAYGSVPGPENTVTLFENPSAPQQSSTAREYMGSPLQEAMAGFGSNLTLAGKESSLIVPRTLTTADEITGSTAADQPFWPLSKTEAERIGNTDILKAANIAPLACYWLRTPEGSDNYVYAVNRSTGTVIRELSNGVYGVRPAFYLDISNAFYLAKDAKRVTIGGNPYPLVLENYEEYKYTIFDDSLKLSVTADPTQAAQTGETLSFGYIATTGENQYLSCVLTPDGSTDVLYYNKLVKLDATAASGTVNIPLTGVADGDYTLRLYTEQQNSKSTDFASPSVDVQITVNSGVASIRNLGNVQLVGDSGGQDGREVELRTTDTHIQWRYEGEGDDAWRDLVALSAITGGDGADGREIQLQVANGYIQWKYDTDTQWNDLLSLSELQGQDGREIELQNNGTAIQWRYEGETEWKDVVDLSAITGGDGREIQLRVDGGYIQWKYSTDPDTEWQNLIAVSALQGMKGDKGDKGDPGRDGSDGSDGRDGRDGKDGEDGEDGLTPFIGSNGNWWIGAADTGVPAAGADGAPGRDGVGISGLLINEAGELVITLTDGTENNLGRVTGEDGAGIAGISINEAGELIVTLTDGTELNAGVVPTNGPEMSCLRLLVYLALGMSALSLTGLLVAGGLWYRRRRASRS